MKTNLPSSLTSLTLVLLSGVISTPALVAQETTSRQTMQKPPTEETGALERLGRFLFTQTRKLEVSQQTSAKTRPAPSTGAISQRRAPSGVAGTSPGMVLTSRTHPAGSTVIYRAPNAAPSVPATQTVIGPDGVTRRILQPGEAATIGWQSRPVSDWQTQEITTEMEPPSPQSPVESAPVSRPVLPPRPPIDKASLPVAKWSQTMGRVVSPYEPYNELDVTGLPAGSLARDPVSGKIFRLP